MPTGLSSPPALGLPAKFDAWRPDQGEALEPLLDRPQRADAVPAPTGFGKSLLITAEALLSPQPTAIVTHSRGLQDQLELEFPGLSIASLKGKSNYPCSYLGAEGNCEEGAHAKCAFAGTVQCPNSRAEMRASVSRVVVTNYAKWTTSKLKTPGLMHIQRVTFDEAHEAPQALEEAVHIELTAKSINDDVGWDFPSSPEEMTSWKPWAQSVRLDVLNMTEKLKRDIKDSSRPKQAWVRQLLHFQNLRRKLDMLANAKPHDWIVEESEKGWMFDPIAPARYVEMALFFNLPRINLVSATLRPKAMARLNLGRDKYHFQEFPSDFSADRCPIISVPTLRVAYGVEDLSELWRMFDAAASLRRDRKGICHTVSFDLQRQLMAASRFSHSFIANRQGDATPAMIERFKRSKPGTILATPSVGAGYDFPGRDCEFQFLLKIPFPPGRSKIMAARKEADPDYLNFLTMNKLVQMCGRGMRFKQDRCQTIIVDSRMTWFMKNHGYLAPKWFHQFYQTMSHLPAPLPALAA